MALLLYLEWLPDEDGIAAAVVDKNTKLRRSGDLLDFGFSVLRTLGFGWFWGFLGFGWFWGLGNCRLFKLVENLQG